MESDEEVMAQRRDVVGLGQRLRPAHAGPCGVNVWLSALPDRIGRTSKCDEWCRRAPAAPWFDAAAATVAPAMSRLAGTTAAASIFAVRRVIGSMGPRFQDARGMLTDQSYWRRPTGCRPLPVRPVNARPSLAGL